MIMLKEEQKCRNTEMQKYRNTEMQKCINTKFKEGVTQVRKQVRHNRLSGLEKNTETQNAEICKCRNTEIQNAPGSSRGTIGSAAWREYSHGCNSRPAKTRISC